MPSEESPRADERADRGTQRRGRGYTIAGAGLVTALALVVVAAMAGIVGPGLFSVDEAFFVLGASMAVLSLAVAVTLFSMHKTLNLVRRQQNAIDDLQDERFRAVEEEQGRTDREQGQEIAQLRAALADARSDRANTRRAGLPANTPFGDIHPVIDVEGIGEDFSAQLQKLNIVDTEQLWQADPDVLASELDVRKKTVRGWQAMAELMALKTVGPQYAELLVRAGISSIDELAAMEPEEVARVVQQAEADREVRIQGNPISAKHTSTWIQAARDHDPKAMRVER